MAFHVVLASMSQPEGYRAERIRLERFNGADVGGRPDSSTHVPLISNTEQTAGETEEIQSGEKEKMNFLKSLSF